MADGVPTVSERALEAAGIGGWELDLVSGRLSWTALTYRIHDLDPGHQPTLDGALDFYAPAARPVITQAVQEGIRSGAPWDLELPFVTARGRQIWVRACGQADREGGRTVRLFGAFQDITERREVARQAERLSIIARQMTSAIVMTDREGRTEWLNEAFTRLTGYSLDEMRGKKPGAVLRGPATDAATGQYMRDCVREGVGFEADILNYTRQGRPYWIAVTGMPLRDEAGAVTGFIAVETDITARRAAEDRARQEAAERQRTEALLRDVLDALPSGVLAYDQDERLLFVNGSYAELFPIGARIARPGTTLEDFVRRSVAGGQFPEAGPTQEEREAWIERHLAMHRTPGPPRTLRLPDGRFALARERRSPSGNLVCVRTDTTNLLRAQADLRRQAERDPLTGLANRPTLLAALERALAPAPPAEHPGGTLLLLDVDYFKQINDTQGHDVGDALLVELAARLRAHTRATDLAARLGGDEYGMVLPGLTDARAVAARIDALHAALSAPVVLGQRPLSIGISIGVTVFPDDGADAARLLKNADLALYDAKRAGRGRWSRFRPEQAAALDHHVHLAEALRQAIARNAITVALQPKRRLRGGHAGFEALARWHDGARWVPPVEFIPVAEDSGLIVPLGRAVMQAALARMSWLREQGAEPGRVAVNVTGPQLLDPGFAAETLEALRRHGLRPTDLEMEITETVLLGRAAERIEVVLRAFSDLGIALALDDFGTGFASLANLSRLPIDHLKIDRSFVAEIGGGGTGGVIARTVVSLAHSLGMEAIAEGIETEAQLAFLDAAGCDAGQGYLFARPLLTAEEAADYLRTHGEMTEPAPLASLA